MKNQVIKKFKDKILAFRNYKSAKPHLFVDDFLDPYDLLFNLYEVDTTEATLTEDGVFFLKEYYGLDKVAELVQKDIREGVDFRSKTKKQIIHWIQNRGRPYLSDIFESFDSREEGEKVSRIKFALQSHYSIQEIAKHLNISQEKILKKLKEPSAKKIIIRLRS